MSVFLSPSLAPILGATYLPPEDRDDQIGLPSVVRQLAQSWRYRRTQLEERANGIVTQLREHMKSPSSFGLTKGSNSTSSSSSGNGDNVMDGIKKNMLSLMYSQSLSSFDTRYGGFGGIPKFLRPVVFNALFRIYHTWRDYSDSELREHATHALHMCTHTLDQIAHGGTHDHIGGGFHQYSTTKDWHIPHYEKMLFDQSQIAMSYIDAYQITHKPLYEHTARGVLDYVASDVMRHPDGGFFSAQSADSLPPTTRTMGVTDRTAVC